VPGTDINVDMGEAFGAWPGGPDEAMLAAATSANIACGFHAGDPRVMARTVALCRDMGKAVGAHPAYPDLVGFGRRALAASPDEVRSDVLYQLGALAAFCRAAGVRLRHVKAHGALYNVAVRDAATARAIAEAVAAFDPGLWVYALPGSELGRAAAALGLRVAWEAFADRGVQADGTLVPRGQPGDLITDPHQAAARAVRIAREGVVVPAGGGEPIPWRADTICVHSDTPGAPAIAAAVRAALAAAGVAVAPLGD
jgi:UPF0271 protein